jgi:pimeloyl-ACP methyl ester carboxylesterase
MRFWNHCECPYPFVPVEVLDQAESARASLPNRYCDPRVAARLYDEVLDEYQLCDELGIHIDTNEHHSGINNLYAATHLITSVVARLTRNVRILSMGTLAAELAVSCSHRLDRLVLADALGIKVSGREERDIAHVFNTHPAEIERRAWCSPDRQPDAGFGFGWQQHVARIADEDLVRLARSWDALCLYGWQPYLYNPGLARWLHRIHVPTLVLWGEADGIVSPAYGRAFAGLIPGARFACIAQAGHHPELEQPRAFAARVLDFLAG